MSADEIRAVSQRYRARLEAILTAEELTLYDAYHQRIQARIACKDTTPVERSAAEQAVVDKIEADTQAAALNKQFFVLLGLEHLPQ